jgi:hypothetical protein
MGAERLHHLPLSAHVLGPDTMGHFDEITTLSSKREYLHRRLIPGLTLAIAAADSATLWKGW